MSVSRLVAAESARQLPSLLPPESPESEGGRSLASRGRRRNEPPPNPKGRSVRASSIPHSLPPSFVGGGAGAEIGVVVLSGESGSDSALFSLGRREQQSLLLLSEYIAKVSEAYFLRSMFPRLFQLRTNNTTYVCGEMTKSLHQLSVVVDCQCQPLSTYCHCQAHPFLRRDGARE